MGLINAYHRFFFFPRKKVREGGRKEERLGDSIFSICIALSGGTCLQLPLTMQIEPGVLHTNYTAKTFQL